MTARARLTAVGCALALSGAVVLAQIRVDAARQAAGAGDLLYLPNEKLLTHFTGGMSSIVADLIWLRCIGYVVQEAKGERHFTWLAHMLNTAVRLDPHFVDVYRYGGMFLAALKADSDASLDLLHEGFVRNPHAWALPYECAMIYLLNRRGEPGARAAAASYLKLSAATGNAPPMVIDLAARLQSETDLTGIERDLWTRYLNSGDQFLRDLAERKLIELDMIHVASELTKMSRDFAARNGRPPRDIDELYAAFRVEQPPHDPLGGGFLVAPDGTVLSTTVLDERMRQILPALEDAVSVYRKRFSTAPPSLSALVDAGIMPEIPAHPYPGRDWQYDASTGTVR